jgi:hypothetical protein
MAAALKIDRVRIEWGTEPDGNLYCEAVAEVSYPTRSGRRLETLHSGGLYGIDPTIEGRDLKDIEAGQLEDLADHLGAFGIVATPTELGEAVDCWPCNKCGAKVRPEPCRGGHMHYDRCAACRAGF